MDKATVIAIPLKTISEANVYEHWTAKKKRRDAQKIMVKTHLNQCNHKITIPCHIKITRIGKKLMDSDNLPTSQKWVRDAIADYILPGLRPGIADNKEGFSWEYDQQIGKEYSIIIEIRNK